MTNLPLELRSILNLMRINFFIGQAQADDLRSALICAVSNLEPDYELLSTEQQCHRTRDGNGPGRPRAGQGRAWKSRPAGLTDRNGPKKFLFKSPLCNGKFKILLMFYKFY